MDIFLEITVTPLYQIGGCKGSFAGTTFGERTGARSRGRDPHQLRRFAVSTVVALELLAMMKSVVTRFRAYQLGCPGSSFSLLAGGHFTVMEGRLTGLSGASLEHEMRLCGVDSADNLDITSWDSDHCNRHELQELLELIQPPTIQCPGYDPYTDHGEGCIEIIGAYRDRPRNTNRKPRIEHITPASIANLGESQRLGFSNLFHGPLPVGSMPTTIRP